MSFDFICGIGEGGKQYKKCHHHGPSIAHSAGQRTRVLPSGKGSHLLEDLARAIDLPKPGSHHEGRVLQVVLDVGICPPLVQQLLDARCLTPERWVG